jgi:hypothetical protein
MSKSREWANLCREHKAGRKNTNTTRFAPKLWLRFLHKSTARSLRGRALEEPENEEKARRQLEEIRARMQTFIGANTWPLWRAGVHGLKKE